MLTIWPMNIRLKINVRRAVLLSLLALTLCNVAACSHAHEADSGEEAEALSRTEFTERVENFFEYAPLKAGQKSEFLIHLTDLSDGTPVAKAEVDLIARDKSGAEVFRTRARVGRVTGIYVADVTLPSAGAYKIDFQIRNEKLDESMRLTDFMVE